MFELAGLSTFLDIFQKAFGLIEKRKDQKRRLFEEIIEPIYTQLSPVVDGYYEFFRGCRDEFSQNPAKKWPVVLLMKKKKREEIVLARDRVIGMIWPFLKEQKHGEQDKLLYSFAKGIEEFFYASDDVPKTIKKGSRARTLLFEELDRIVWKQDEKYRQFVISEIELVLQTLEQKWRDVSAAYGELRVYCLS